MSGVRPTTVRWKRGYPKMYRGCARIRYIRVTPGFVGEMKALAPLFIRAVCLT